MVPTGKWKNDKQKCMIARFGSRNRWLWCFLLSMRLASWSLLLFRESKARSGLAPTLQSLYFPARCSPSARFPRNDGTIKQKPTSSYWRCVEFTLLLRRTWVIAIVAPLSRPCYLMRDCTPLMKATQANGSERWGMLISRHAFLIQDSDVR